MDRNKAGMKKPRRLPDIRKNAQQMHGTFVTFFHLCLLSVLFSGATLYEMTFYKIIFLISLLL